MDLLDKCVVRVEQGDQNRKKMYSIDPVNVVQNFAHNGATLVHVVDLNAAIRNDPETNNDVIVRILSESPSINIQLAGGIRNENVETKLLNNGAQRVVISSLAYSNPDMAYDILQTFGAGRIVIALDYDSEGMIRTSGWSKRQDDTVYEAVSRFSRMVFSYFLTTAVHRDGLLMGPDTETLLKLREENPPSSVRLIASGGITTEEDLRKLANMGMDEAIVGKAVYEGKIPLSAISRFS